MTKDYKHGFKVGQKFFVYDSNRRKYDENRKTIREYHTFEVVVEKVTPRSMYFKNISYRFDIKEGRFIGDLYGLCPWIYYTKEDSLIRSCDIQSISKELIKEFIELFEELPTYIKESYKQTYRKAKLISGGLGELRVREQFKQK